ncbi:MAG: alpha/beta fold hydrolase [Phycisphaerales bacterium]|nr:MAG: alpha/beta fold hydrolase [Phycisphaerales bacterium]
MRATRTIISAVVIGAGVVASPLAADEPVGERATFQTHDNEQVTIVGDFYAAQTEGGELPPVVILLHMYKRDRSDWKPLIPELQRRGISALAIDLRGHGESIEPTEANLAERVANREKRVYENMKHDVAAAHTWLAEQGKVDLSRFGLVGASVGCTVAFQYAGDDLSVDAIVAMSPGTSYMKIRSEKDIDDIVGRAIWLVSPAAEIANANALKAANPDGNINVKEVTAEGEDPDVNIHGTNMFGKVGGIERDIAGYLERFLGDPAEEPVVYELRRKFYVPADAERAGKMSVEKKRYLSSPEEAEERGLKEFGQSGREQGASGVVDA